MDRNFPRLLDTLSVLQRSSRLSTTDIQQRLEALGHHVTARTVQRDLEQLAAQYPLECDDRSKPFAWSWRKDAARLSLPGMEWPEAVSLHLLSTYLDGVLPPSVRSGIDAFVVEARRKMGQHVENLPMKRWPERVRVVHQSVPMLTPAVRGSVQAAMTEAVLLGRKVRMRYRSMHREGTHAYVVEPLGLVQNGPVFYLPVRFEGHDDVRTITLHRVERAEVLPDKSAIEQFDLAGWIEAGALGFGGDALIELVMQLDADALSIVAESPLSKDQRIDAGDGDWHTVSATVRDTAQFRRWLLGLGRRVRVMQPAALAADMRAELQAALLGYPRA